MRETVFAVPKMDCPSEERMIRTALDGVAGIRGITCDLAARRVRIVHDGEPSEVEARLVPLGLGAARVETCDVLDAALPAPLDPAREVRTLKLLLAINAAMFVIELTVAWVAASAGLLADSLDMFADAAVYGLALYAVGRSAAAKLRTAHVAGWLQAALALGALVEVARRAVAGSEPASTLMMAMALVALVANAACLWLVSQHRDGGAHMKASVIFSANDVLANLGVIAAGALVALTGSRYPDLVIGTVIAIVVLLGDRRILRRSPRASSTSSSGRSPAVVGRTSGAGGVGMRRVSANRGRAPAARARSARVVTAPRTRAVTAAPRGRRHRAATRDDSRARGWRAHGRAVGGACRLHRRRQGSEPEGGCR